MKLNELMDGDLVFDKKTKQPRKISGTNDLLFHDDYDPIPLTKEILVKSGFVEIELTDSYELNTDYYEIEVWEFGEGLWVVKVQWIEFSMTPECKATVCYVHQLQHLLQLSGIEKELIIE